ncbi:MAG: 30S ribosomal protein S6 [Deltaproteobacteria bacterium]|nr:30S ribosomal protein S6 [Deltaproteobacteria bacterium]
MQRYEVIAIVLSNVNDDDITALIERSQTIITDRKGVIAKIDKWGKRHLAYEIKKQKDGYYFLIDFSGDGAVVAEIERNYKIDDRVLKFITVKKEGATTREGIDQEIATAEAKRTQARAEGETAGSVEGKSIRQIEKATEETKPAVSSSRKNIKEETSAKGE